MVRGYTQEHVYKHPWERVSAALWRKFSDTEGRRLLTHVSEVHTLGRSLDDTGRLHSHRLIAFKLAGPLWLNRLTRQKTVHCLESSEVDPGLRTMRITTRNVTLRDFVDVIETTFLEPSAEKPEGWTVCHQETNIRCAPVSSVVARLAEKIETRCAERFLQNSAKGRDVIEKICNYLEAEKI